MNVEYRELEGLDGWRFGDDASVWNRCGPGSRPKPGGVPRPWRETKPSTRPTGFSWIYIGPRNRTKPVRVDELICEAWWGDRPVGAECLHLDGDRKNCRPSNLRWGNRDARDPNAEYRTIDEAFGYEFGSDGSVWSCWGTGFSEAPGNIWRKMLLTPLESGHLQVNIKWNGVRRVKGVHHLICIAWHGYPPEGAECCHNDGFADHNWPGNLRWGTSAENMADRKIHAPIVNGEKQLVARLTDDQIRSCRRDHATGVPDYVLRKQYGVSGQTIRNLLMGRTHQDVV